MLTAFARSSNLSPRSFCVPVILAIAAMQFASPARAQLNIVPTFDSTITNDPNSAAIQSTINAAIQEYRNFFSNNITVNITFQEGGGLGSSNTAILSIPYTTYRAALVSHATTANDATANLSLPVQTNSPVDGQSDLFVTTANARALGLTGPGGNDSIITLNTSIMNFTRPPGNPAKYDLKAVAQHEMDEALGFGSGLNLPVSFPRQSRPQDLFRYNGKNSRSYSTSTSEVSYFSIDGGNINLVGFNQSSSGDYGDWVSGSGTVRVQDAFGTPGATPNLGVELTNLDVIGYSLVGVPEPGTLGLLTAAGLAVGGVIRRRRKAVAA